MQPAIQDVMKLLQKRDYIVKGQIGQGSQGFCLVVESSKYKVDFVCKCMKLKGGANDTATKSGFEREIYTLSHFNHPHIVKIYDYFTDQEYLFMILEYCQQGSLNTIFKSDGHKNYSAIRKVIEDILSALEYCHEVKHISHHDIKLHNILMDSYGNAKLCDFGISQFIRDQLASDYDISTEIQMPNGLIETPGKQNVCGSILYMSPQLLFTAGHPENKYDLFAADMWALGITIYVLLTGRYPFIGHSKQDVLNDQVNQYNNASILHKKVIYPPRPVPRDVPEDILYVMNRCLEFHESNRGTAKELFYYLQSTNKEKLPHLTKSTSSFSQSLLIRGGSLSKFHIKKKLALSKLSNKSAEFSIPPLSSELK